MTQETYSFVPSTDFDYPNITIYKKMRDSDNVQVAWRANANEGYVFYDQYENNTEWNEELQEEVPVIYYHRVASIPLNFNFANFPYVAVLESEVDENYIFGINNQETI